MTTASRLALRRRRFTRSRQSRSIVDRVQDRVQDAEATNAKAGGQKAKRTRRPAAGGDSEADVSARTLLSRLEQQSGQLAVLRQKLEETESGLLKEREASRGARGALEEERRTRARLEASLRRERAARQQAEGAADEARATASALEAQHHLLRAQLKALQHETRRRFPLRRGR
jgi:hypothetical protein